MPSIFANVLGLIIRDRSFLWKTSQPWKRQRCQLSYESNGSKRRTQTLFICYQNLTSDVELLHDYGASKDYIKPQAQGKIERMHRSFRSMHRFDLISQQTGSDLCQHMAKLYIYKAKGGTV